MTGSGCRWCRRWAGRTWPTTRATAATSTASRDGAEVEALVADWTRRHTRAELTALLGGEIPFAPVYTAADVFADPHYRARQMLVETEFPGAANPLVLAGTPVKMSETPGAVRHRAPLVGEHSEAVLSEFGFDASGNCRVARGRYGR